MDDCWPCCLPSTGYSIGSDQSTQLSPVKDGDFAAHECTGKPLEDVEFIGRIERSLDRSLKKKKPGPKQRQDN